MDAFGATREPESYDVLAPEFGTEIPPLGLGAFLEPVGAALFAPAPAAAVAEPDPVSRLGGLASRLPEWEQAIIAETAARKGVDPVALAAIRLQENGGPGREFGVLSVSAPTYQAQADIAANSLKNSEQRYSDATGLSPKDGAGRYTPAFWDFFGRRWAPIDAANDPQGLNRYWTGNVIAFYQGSTASA